MITNCSTCGNEMNRKPSEFKKYTNLFCSSQCRDSFQKTGYKVNCATCGKDLYRTESQYAKSNSKTFFCNKSCSASYNNQSRHKNIDDIKSYRIKAFKTKPKECERCGFNKYLSILQVHHKDHNRENNHISNLEVLCPNCHMIEHIEKYGNLNNKPTTESS